MINFFFLLKYRYLFNPPLTPLQSSGRLAVQQMEENAVVMLIISQPGKAGRTTPSNSHFLLVVPTPTTLWPCCPTWTPVLWVADPFSLQSSLLPLDSQIISTWWYPHLPAEGLKSQSLFLPCPLAGEHAVCGWAGIWEASPGRVLSALEQCTQRNDMEIDAGRLVPAVINE